VSFAVEEMKLQRQQDVQQLHELARQCGDWYRASGKDELGVDLSVARNLLRKLLVEKLTDVDIS